MTNTDSSRNIWVFNGNLNELIEQLRNTIKQHQGDWLTITDQTILQEYITNFISPSKAKTLLGQEFLHAIFDATQGFNLEAFAMLAGTLVKGSVLILLLPKNIETWQDLDSLRWNENPEPIKVPNFVKHLKQTLELASLSKNDEFPCLHNVNDHHEDQKSVLQQLLASRKPIHVLTAQRGRGKSALAGQFSQFYHCVVTAPNKKALTTFYKFANQNTLFLSPDELIEKGFHDTFQYLIIDEAAMIPLPMLNKLIQLATSEDIRILLVTTLEGYEGTGQGFIIKLLHNYNVDYFYLKKPIRWCNNDQLEYFTHHLLLDGTSFKSCSQPLNHQLVDYSMIARHDLKTLKEIFYLLKIAHYQTTLIDLRRILDAHNLDVWGARIENKLIAAAVTVNEGDLSDRLIDDVWKGIRRPRGNMLAQSLVAHAGERSAAKLKSVRINRIAVFESYRRQKIAKQLINKVFKEAVINGIDFLSVSFAYSNITYEFWKSLGFLLVHIGSRRETSSGTYSIMAIKPISQNAFEMANKLNKKLRRDIFWIKDFIDLPFETMLLKDDAQFLSDQDIDDLQGFCYYHRPFEATYASLCRMSQYNDHSNNQLRLPILKALITNKKNEFLVIEQFRLNGRKALITSIKQEVNQWLHHTNQIETSNYQSNKLD